MIRYAYYAHKLTKIQNDQKLKRSPFTTNNFNFTSQPQPPKPQNLPRDFGKKSKSKNTVRAC